MLEDRIKLPGDVLIHSKLSCGKSILELSEFDNIALWWFFDTEFFYDFRSVVDRRERTIIQRSITEKVFTKVSILSFFFRFLLKFICKLTILCINTKRSDNKKPKILFTGLDREWSHLYDANGKLVKYDQFFDSIIKYLQKQKGYSLLSVYPLNIPFNKTYSIFIDKRLHWDVRHIPFDLFYDTTCNKKRDYASHHFKKIWEMIENDPAFEQLLTKFTNNNNIYIKGFFEKRFTETFPYMVVQIQMAINLIKKEQPSLILLEHEYIGFERALIVAAKKCDVPTLAIQHGVVDPSEPAYIHVRLESFNNLTRLECPKPTKTAVYGEFEKEILINRSDYSEDEVVVTGPHRYDSYIVLNDLYSKENFCEKFGLEIKNKLILWATQSHSFGNDENEKNFDAVFSAIKQLKDVVLIIKQHPDESKKERDIINLINKFKDLYKFSFVLLPDNSDMTEALFICDLLITKHSMTGLEAIALNKPVIVLNLTGFPDIVDYVKEGVASGVYNKDNLKSVIEQLLHDDSDLKRNRANYVKNHLYAVDGKATERIVNVIEELIEKKE